MTTGKPYKLEVFPSEEELDIAAAEYIIDRAKNTIASKGKFVIALSGGRTPQKLFELLAQPLYTNKIDWKSTYVFWGDERCVPLDDERNNAFQAKNILLDKVNIPASNIYRIPVDLPPVAAASNYERTLDNFFENNPIQFDLILLGLGENGHTASLFPGTNVIEDTSAGIRDVYVEEEKMFRITMTAPLINEAHAILFLVTGKEKAEILNKVLNVSTENKKYPAQLICPKNGNLYWFADSEAASLLAK